MGMGVGRRIRTIGASHIINQYPNMAPRLEPSWGPLTEGVHLMWGLRTTCFTLPHFHVVCDLLLLAFIFYVFPM